MVRTFPAGSSGGPDEVRQQHIAEFLNSQDAGPRLLTELTALVNLFLAGTCPPSLYSLLFGGYLTVLRKNTGGSRPIVVGYIWHRIASKCANAHAVPLYSLHI